MGVNKKLVFHFYADKGWEDNIANICHFNCLKHFSNVFNEAVIVVSDGGVGKDEILKIKGKFTEITGPLRRRVKSKKQE